MSDELTPRRTLESLKKEAKRWLASLRAGDPAARARLERAHPHAATTPTLRDVQHALAREHGCFGWTALAAELARMRAPTPEAAVQALAKAGTLSIIGVYPESATSFPIGKAMGKNLTLKMGNCNHRRFVPSLIDLVRTKRIDPSAVLSHKGPLVSAIDAYKAFDRREAGWVKVELKPSRDNGAQAQASSRAP